MSTIRPLIEDRYIAHLAGFRNGKSPINSTDRYQATCAQNYPITNAVSAAFSGFFKSAMFTATGVLTVTLVKEGVMASVFGSKAKVCGACAANSQTVLETVTKVSKDIFVTVCPYFDENCKNVSDFMNYIPKSVSSTISSSLDSIFNAGTKGFSFLSGLAQANQCANDPNLELQCRAINYGGSVINTVSENLTTIAAVAVSLAVISTIFHNTKYSQDEQEAGNDVKNSLSVKYLQIANRLKNLEKNEQTEMLAKKILERQAQIHEEIKSLEIPNLSWREIEYITLPVLLAAKEKISQEG